MRVRVALRGAVQGVGFRPFVHRLATELAITGWVNNSPQGVLLEAEGERQLLEHFLLRLHSDKPRLSFIQGCETAWLDPRGFTQFDIRASTRNGGRAAFVLPDIATCPDCLREIFDPRNRRYRYPFTNCTHCGPRFSIIEALPYDRLNTSMKQFKMCAACQAEYDDPRNRRFHAQPNACPDCGPQLEFLSVSGGTHLNRKDTLEAAAQAIRAGQIVAVKGIGGFHLLTDARNEDSVHLLRARKHREEKPFALMFPSLPSVRVVAEVSPLEERLLLSPEAPIVLLRKMGSGSSIVADAVAPANPYLGIMLPANPLHHLLLTELGFPLVATSGNLSDEPLCTDEIEAQERLQGIADCFLFHNRPIVRHVDDSIVRVMLDREMVLRRGRGYAPLPIPVPTNPEKHSTFNIQRSTSKFSEGKPLDGAMSEVVSLEVPHAQANETVLAVGAHLKNTVALAVAGNVFLSQHIGDLETEAAHGAFRRVCADLPRLYDAAPDVIAADLHPDYLSTQYARAYVAHTSLPRAGGDAYAGGSHGQAANGCSQARRARYIGVQHHAAHVLSCLAENEVQLPALGVAWDGTGYGTDGMIWGGEFFLVSSESIARVATLRSFPLPGGNVAVKEPRRAALGLLFAMNGDAVFADRNLQTVAAFSPAELALLRTMLKGSLNSPMTSSIGRLFDAVASLVGLRQQMRFEGQAAMELEFALAGPECAPLYSLPVITGRSPMQLDWQPLIQELLADVRSGNPLSQIAAGFHNALAEAIVVVASEVGEARVALSGGCFQNRYLTERTVQRLRDEGFQPYWHQRVPANDGGIALGQVVAALRQEHSLNHQEQIPKCV